MRHEFQFPTPSQAPKEGRLKYRDDLHKARALVVDGNPTTRSVIGNQLRSLGIGQVSLCSRIADARARLETSRYEIVLSENDFPDGATTGQQLLDDLRRCRLLPLSTVFIMITSEATYAKVAEAAESALDSYLLKPFTVANLADRLAHARRRKVILDDILRAVDEGRYAEAAQSCVQRFNDRGEFWLYAARIGAELLLNLNRHTEARQLFDAVVAARALPWAKLGIARAQIESGEPAKATFMLEALIGEDPNFVDAYDVMGRARLEQGDFDGAMDVYQKALALTPESLHRLQKAGMLAYYRNQLDEAGKNLERAVRVGIASKMFDWQTLVLLGFVRFREADARGVLRCRDELVAMLGKTSDKVRMSRFARVVRALVAQLYEQTTEAQQLIRELAAEIGEQDHDVEAAGNLVALLATLAAGGLWMPEAETWIDRMASRHCSSRILVEVLMRAAAAHPPYVERVQEAYTALGKLAEDAMVYSLRGQPERTVRCLLDATAQTLSSRLLDAAFGTLKRHRGRISDADAAAFGAEIESLRKRMAPPRSPLVESNGRKAGALVLRQQAVSEPDARQADTSSAATTL